MSFKFESGTVYFIKQCKQSIPPKDKFVICISNKDNLFLFINSVDEKRPYQYEKDHLVYLETHQLQCLSHQSYINITKYFSISGSDFTSVEKRENLNPSIKLTIKTAIQKDKTIFNKIKRIIDETFS